jgi:hypothetical protein
MPGATKLDLSVAGIDDDVDISAFSIPAVNHIRSISDIMPDDTVVFYGKVSNRVEAQIKHVCIWYEIEINGELHCFGDIFEIELPRPWLLNLDLCKRGDSGAWVISRSGEVLSWDGMLFAGDGANGYCCFAEHIMEVCSTAFPDGLALIA